ncbi:hypothetical protein Vadar_032900 [Vaccinium darrowii]|uniref:Uncharacterized protein n=1 Tax=Vaccinium darrowii TaxID=229202 RepID=A0ACB7Z927_9ERIC|nr:hypothetical protein Vadar_032900 [Vaccinium darrowii]
MHVIVTDISNRNVWATTFVYGCPRREGRELVWEKIRSIARLEFLPWMCMGDFNQILSGNDKLGGHYPNQVLISSFHGLITDCGLVDLEFKGPKFTWRNNRSGENFIMERLDMAFANSKWREIHDKAMVFIEPAIGSDHNPLVLNTEVPSNEVGKPFRFESFWVTEEGCNTVIQDSWSLTTEGTSMISVCKKLRFCKESLKAWSKENFGDLRLKINAVKEELVTIQHQLEHGFRSDLVTEERRLLHLLEDLWQKDAIEPPQRDFEDLISLIDPIISADCNSSLAKSVTIDEVQIAVFQMGAFKAPGSDGFPGLFYQRYWDIVGADVLKAVQTFFLDGTLLAEQGFTEKEKDLGLSQNSSHGWEQRSLP